MMKRKYNRPAIKAIALRQQQHLLSGSSGIPGIESQAAALARMKKINHNKNDNVI